MHVLGPGYPKNILKSVTRVCTIALPPKMARSAGGAAKPATKGVMSSAKKLAERAKAARAEKCKVPSDEDEMEDDEEEQTSDSDSGAPLIQALSGR